MNILVFDVETTGLAYYNKPLTDPSQPHIVQLSALQIHVTPAEPWVRQSLSLIVEPGDWEIPDEATQVHGISTDYALDWGQPEEDVLRSFLPLWVGNGESSLLVSHNVKFDHFVISTAIARFMDETTLKQWTNANMFCTMEQSKPLVQARNSRGALKYPKLTEAYEFFFNEPLDRAHSANADTVACMQIYFALQQCKVVGKNEEESE